MTARAVILLGASMIASCASAAEQPVPNLSPSKISEPPGAPQAVEEELGLPPADTIPVQRTSAGAPVQGALTFWKTEAGSEVFLDKKEVPVDADGHFALGFGRDYQGEAELLVILPSGEDYRQKLLIGEREFPESRLTIADTDKVNPYKPEDLKKIRKDQAAKAEARSNPVKTSYWRSGWEWPLYGRISGVYGSRRILNGTPKRPHSGVDVARIRGTNVEDFIGKDIRAPSAGKVTLALEGMFFEGGLILIDHGQEVESAMLHLSRIDVKPGDVVSKGQVIGGVGGTGRATGPHLHWTVNWQGQPMDPQLLVGDIREAARR